VELRDAIDQYKKKRHVAATDPAPAAVNTTSNFRRHNTEIVPVPNSLAPGYGAMSAVMAGGVSELS
jgi:hypothetical protein